jgi:CRISPR-associated protein Csm4
MKFSTVYLIPKSQFPEILGSDTIFGAIWDAINHITSEQHILEKPPFVISSAFPFFGDFDLNNNPTNVVHFFPKLINRPNKSYSNSHNIKDFKNIKYIHENIFRDIISGNCSESDIVSNIKNYGIYKGLLLTKEDNLKIRNLFSIKPSVIPHNVLNRITSKSENLFFDSGNSFKNGGLFFMVRYLDPTFQKYVEGALRFLADRGFGGNISTGKGHFDVDFGEISFEDIQGEFFVTLSLYSPTKEELNNFPPDMMWYELEKREGRCRDNVMKKSLLMFKEGSTFKNLQNREFYGKIEEVRKNPLVYQNALAFPLTMR